MAKIIIVNNGAMFHGTFEHFKNCFGGSATEESVKTIVDKWGVDYYIQDFPSWIDGKPPCEGIFYCCINDPIDGPIYGEVALTRDGFFHKGKKLTCDIIAWFPIPTYKKEI